MSTTTTKIKYLTVADAAEKLGLTTGRIRQLCKDMELGFLVGNLRLLSPAEVRLMANREDGRKSKNNP